MSLIQPKSESFFHKRLAYPWIQFSITTLYCSHCSLSQRIHLYHTEEDFDRFVRGHIHCTLPPKKELSQNNTIAPIDNPSPL
jgi:hypothetical protein